MMEGKIMILPCLYKFLTSKNTKEKVKLVFDLFDYYKSSKEQFLTNVKRN